MSDAFYNDFDQECFCDDSNRPRTPDYRSVFQQDRDRIMFSPAFRRLQAKTQVFQAGEYDFYRTRLTHSLEVSRIAESIALWLRIKYPEVQINLHLLEAICLAHDIGHPPFGHAGERVLNELMQPYGGFEGNAQSLRLLTKTLYGRTKDRGGMSPSRALLDGILKYKPLFADRAGKKNHFIYDDQIEIISFCFGTTNLKDQIPSCEANDFKSIECQIMDAADDIAYSCFDILDGWKARFLNPDKLEAWRERKKINPGEKGPLDTYQLKQIDNLSALMKDGTLQPRMNVLIGELIQSISLEKRDNFMTQKTCRYGYKLAIETKTQSLISLHKALCQELVFGSSALQQIEFKGEQILRQLTRALFKNYLCTTPSPAMLVPADVHNAVVGANEKSIKARLICDHISGMTDAYALRSYKRLFDPDYGSISELI